MGKKRNKESNVKNLNLTSMMDVVFQLIIFFILISNFTTNELPDLKPPEFDNSKAQEVKIEDRIVINLIPQAVGERNESKANRLNSWAKRIKIGQNPSFERVSEDDEFDWDAFGLMLENEKLAKEALMGEQGPDGKGVQVNLRVDSRIHYKDAAQVMKAIVKKGIRRVNLVAVTEDD